MNHSHIALAIVGYGKMGRAVEAVAAESGDKLVSSIDPAPESGARHHVITPDLLEGVEVAHFAQQVEGDFRFRGVHKADGESRVDEDVIAHLGFGQQLDADDAAHAAKFDFGLGAFDGKDFCGYGKAHERLRNAE
jgi:hypothetical protein